MTFKNRLRAGALTTLLFTTLVFHCIANAAPAEKEIPEPLKPWSSWVLRDLPDQKCPFFYNNGDTRACAWPSTLALALDKHGGSFSQRIEVFKTMHIALPGDADAWPQDVKVDGKAVAVSGDDSDRPTVMISAGSHIVSGTLVWDDMPESLQVPQQTGLVSLRLEGHEVLLPKLETDGHLWLRSQSQHEAGTADTVELHVSRRIDDDIPLVITTHLDLSVSGKNREVVLPGVLLSDFTPVAIDSPLPTRLEANGALRVQLRPGHWELTISAHQSAAQTAITLPASNTPLADQEIWVFQSHNELRVVTPSGGAPVDAKLVSMPNDWKGLPAFQLKPGESLKLVESKRGDPLAAPDNLTLERHIWLDFNGGGYTIHDNISGNIHRNWRLDMLAPAVLGRAAVNGEDQFITHSGDSSGVEIRYGSAGIKADSRIDSATRSFGATGWHQDFQNESAHLHLPPGWRLLAASGTDKAPGSWVAQWSLLDFFIVLIVALAFGKLWGWRWGATALVAMALVYHEPNAPRWIWLAVLIGAGLMSVLPETGRLHRIAFGYRAATLLVLLLISLPFSVGQIRQAIYPVLEQSENSPILMARSRGDLNAEPAPAPVEEMEDKKAEAQSRVDELEAPPKRDAPIPAFLPSISKSMPVKQSAGLVAGKLKSLNPLSQRDPNAVVQTGPGLPTWHWHDYDLVWNGPVEQGQELHLWLISPAMNALLSILRVLLISVLFARLIGYAPGWPPSLKGKKLPPSNLAALLLVAGSCLLVPQAGRAADIPGNEMLEQLKTELIKPPECLPNCADIARMNVDVKGEILQLRLEVHALQNAAVPLPSAAAQWVIRSISLDGKPASGLMKSDDGQLWLALEEGVHQIVMQGAVGHTENVQLSLPLKPHRVDAKTDGWTLSGVRDNGLVDDNLQLTHVAGIGKSSLHDAVLPSFVKVERTLELGLQWRVHTRVVRVAPAEGPLIVAVPLLPGESIAGAEPRVDKGAAQVSLPPQETEISWDSTLAQTPGIALKAATQSDLMEQWELDVGTAWHVDISGIPVIRHQTPNGHWQPMWRPWPGEVVQLKITKPAGAAGQSLTVESSLLTLTPGLRATTAVLQLRMRSSRGGLHVIKLPENAILQKVSAQRPGEEMQELPLRLEGRELHLPLQTGAQELTIEWRQPEGMTSFYRTPQIDLGSASVNDEITVNAPEDRWTIAIGGPRMGPAILLWGIVVTLALLATALGRMSLTPLKGRHWFLLGLGMTQASPVACVLVAGWLVALGCRQRYGAQWSESSNRRFNAVQILLVLWSAIALTTLVLEIGHSLIGFPDMQITGNGSSSSHFVWYQDSSTGILPQPWVLSLPMTAYRILMLLWALWLAWSLLKWLRWGWTCFNDGGYWRAARPQVKKAAQAPEDETVEMNTPPSTPTSPEATGIFEEPPASP